MKTFYRTGEADTCSEKWSTLFRCLRAKVMEKEKAHALLQGTQLDPNYKPHSAEVWELKSVPGW